MSKKNNEAVKMPYAEHDCPDCLPLLTTFPASCPPVVLDGLRCLVTGQPIADVPCLAHCASTLLWWGESLWLKNHIHESGAKAVAQGLVLAKGKTNLDADPKGAIAELEKLAAHGDSGDTPPSGAIDWQKVFSAILMILNLIKPFIFPPEPKPAP